MWKFTYINNTLWILCIIFLIKINILNLDFIGLNEKSGKKMKSYEHLSTKNTQNVDTLCKFKRNVYKKIKIQHLVFLKL